MNTYDFLFKLNSFFPCNEREEIFKERVNDYANCILSRLDKCKYKCDFEKVFSYILETYQYQKFPSLPFILEALPVGRVIEENYSGREGEVIKRVLNGIEYEFTIVPNHWDKVKTISEIDNELQWRQKRVNT